MFYGFKTTHKKPQRMILQVPSKESQGGFPLWTELRLVVARLRACTATVEAAPHFLALQSSGTAGI